MPKKRVIINQRTIARNVRISERHRQSKAKPPEENPSQTNENERNPKCKLRDVKNNKKKNDKKELGRLLFAKVTPDNGQKNVPAKNVAPVNNANKNKNASPAQYSNNKLFAPPQKSVIKKGETEENATGGPVINKSAPKEKRENLRIEIPNKNVIEAAPANNENATKTTPNTPINEEEKTVINYPKIFGSEVDENLNLVPKNRMTYQDFLKVPGTTYLKYTLNTTSAPQANVPLIVNGIQPGSSNSTNLEEKDDCVNIISSLCKYITNEEKEIVMKKNAEMLKNDIFSSNEKMIIKYISEQFIKLTETSNFLTSTRENLNRIVEFQEKRELKEIQPDKVEEITIKCENGSVYKLKETEMKSKVKEMKIKEKELELLEVDVKNELNNYIQNLPNELKSKIRVAAHPNSEVNKNIQTNSQTSRQHLEQIIMNETGDNRRPITTKRIQGRNNKCPLKLTRKQRKRQKKKFAKYRRCCNNAGLNVPDETEALRENSNISNRTFDLPEQNANETFEINFVAPQDCNNANVSQETPTLNTVMEKLHIIENMLTNSNGSSFNSRNGNNDSEENVRILLNSDEMLYSNESPIPTETNLTNARSEEDFLNMNLSANEIHFLVHMINDRVNFENVQCENYVKKYFSLTEYPKSLFKSTDKKNNSIIKFIHDNFTFVDDNLKQSSKSDSSEYESEMDDYSPEESGTPSEEYDSDDVIIIRCDEDPGIIEDSIYPREVNTEIINEHFSIILLEDEPEIINEIPVIRREVDPEVQERMNQYENSYFDINIAALHQNDEYDKKRNELNEQFADLFEMNYIKI